MSVIRSAGARRYPAKHSRADLYGLGTAIDQRVRRERPIWLHLCDWSLALRWLNSGEWRAFSETCDALDWCRNWAIRQHVVDVTSCLERADTSADQGFDQTLGHAA